MPEKKVATLKKTAVKKTVVAKAAVKKAPVKKAAAKNAAKGEKYECQVCGLAVTVDEACGCVDVCHIICCGKPMKAKKPAVKKAK